MTHKKLDIDNIIDTAAKAVRDERIDDTEIDAATARVFAKIGSTASDSIEGCTDFQSLIPAYLDGTLAASRKLLLEDHVGECVPCRRALKTQRGDAPAERVRTNANAVNNAPLIARRWTKVARWSAAAAIVVGLSLAGLFAFERFDWSGRTLAATLEDSNGSVYIVDGDANVRQLVPGAQLLKGQRVRTAKNSTAVLRLADGSTVEMRERSEFSVRENRRGVTISLDRGDVIVEAAKQDKGRLYVQTPDSLVSVKGTIFAVESGTKGSRVSVVEGEVKVQRDGKDETLLPGDQSTTEQLEKKQVTDTVAWSRNAAKYTTLVAELAKLRREVNERTVMPGVRYSSKLAALAPENTVFFAALPNLTETLADSERIMNERIAQNPVLAEWWKTREAKSSDANKMTFAKIREFGSHFGDEIVVSADTDANGLLILGELKDAAAFRTFLDAQVAELKNSSEGAAKITIVDDPNNAPQVDQTNAKNGGLYVWIHDGIFAAATDNAQLRGLAQRVASNGAGGFANSSFYKRIADAYADGAGILIAADVENIVKRTVAKSEKPATQKEIETFGRLGVLNIRHFVAEQKTVEGRTLSRAELTFGESRRGIASWLAKPGPMGALGFISPDANVATAFVVKEPALLVDDLLGFLETTDPDVRRKFDEIQKTQGFDVRRDFAEPLGGEFAFAIDGPVLPTPSWKAVFEVYDPARLQNSLERAVEKINQLAAESGKQLVWDNTTSGSRTYYSIKSSDAAISVHYVFTDGYMIVAPSRALLDQSLANRESGNTLVRSPRFVSALPRDGNVNFSAIFYHDLASLVGPLAQRVAKSGGDLTDEQRGALDSISVNTPPTLVYAYAGDDRVTFASNTEGGAFGLSPASLIGLPNSFEMENILSNAMSDGKAGTK